MIGNKDEKMKRKSSSHGTASKKQHSISSPPTILTLPDEILVNITFLLDQQDTLSLLYSNKRFTRPCKIRLYKKILLCEKFQDEYFYKLSRLRKITLLSSWDKILQFFSYIYISAKTNENLETLSYVEEISSYNFLDRGRLDNHKYLSGSDFRKILLFRQYWEFVINKFINLKNFIFPKLSIEKLFSMDSGIKSKLNKISINVEQDDEMNGPLSAYRSLQLNKNLSNSISENFKFPDLTSLRLNLDTSTPITNKTLEAIHLLLINSNSSVQLNELELNGNFGTLDKDHEYELRHHNYDENINPKSSFLKGLQIGRFIQKSEESRGSNKDRDQVAAKQRRKIRQSYFFKKSTRSRHLPLWTSQYGRRTAQEDYEEDRVGELNQAILMDNMTQLRGYIEKSSPIDAQIEDNDDEYDYFIDDEEFNDFDDGEEIMRDSDDNDDADVEELMLKGATFPTFDVLSKSGPEVDHQRIRVILSNLLRHEFSFQHLTKLTFSNFDFKLTTEASLSMFIEYFQKIVPNFELIEEFSLRNITISIENNDPANSIIDVIMKSYEKRPFQSLKKLVYSVDVHSNMSDPSQIQQLEISTLHEFGMLIASSPKLKEIVYMSPESLSFSDFYKNFVSNYSISKSPVETISYIKLKDVVKVIVKILNLKIFKKFSEFNNLKKIDDYYFRLTKILLENLNLFIRVDNYECNNVFMKSFIHEIEYFKDEYAYLFRNDVKKFFEICPTLKEFVYFGYTFRRSEVL